MEESHMLKSYQENILTFYDLFMHKKSFWYLMHTSDCTIPSDLQVSKENEVANEEKRRVAIIEGEVAKRRKECEEDLVKAEPALVAAKEALNTLNKVGQWWQESLMSW